MDAKEAYLSKPWLKYYPEGVPAEVETPLVSVPELFDRMADKYADKPALIFYGKKITYRSLKESTDRFAAALADLGVRKGDTVALYLLNCPPVCDCLLRRPQGRGQGDTDKPGLYQQGSQASGGRQRCQDSRL